MQALREGARAEGRLLLLLFGLLPADVAPEAGDRRVVDTLVQPAVRTLGLGDLQRRRHAQLFRLRVYGRLELLNDRLMLRIPVDADGESAHEASM